MVRPKFDEGGNKTALSALAKTAVHPSDCIKLYSNRYPCINPFFLLKVLLFLLLLLLLLLLFVAIVVLSVRFFFWRVWTTKSFFEEREETFLFFAFLGRRRSQEECLQEMVGTKINARTKNKNFLQKKSALVVIKRR